MKLDGLQEEYKLSKLGEILTVKGAFERLQNAVGRLGLDLTFGEGLGERLAEVVVNTVILANLVDVDLTAAVYRKVMKDYRENKLRR